VVLDAKVGPVVLEANARPGLGIQIANRCGLLTRCAGFAVARDGQPDRGDPAGRTRPRVAQGSHHAAGLLADLASACVQGSLRS
jgi:hypothetical protein